MNPLKLVIASKQVSDVGHSLLTLNLDHHDRKIIQKLLVATVISLNSKDGAMPVKRAAEVIEDVLDQLERAQAIDAVPYKASNND
jgi:hypothetical protein